MVDVRTSRVRVGQECRNKALNVRTVYSAVEVEVTAARDTALSLFAFVRNAIRVRVLAVGREVRNDDVEPPAGELPGAAAHQVDDFQAPGTLCILTIECAQSAAACGGGAIRADEA